MRVTQAEASAEERKLAASAEAFSTEVQSKARADAIQREALALKQSPEIIQLRAIEKWDGVLPRISGENGVVPFLNVDELAKPPAGQYPFHSSSARQSAKRPPRPLGAPAHPQLKTYDLILKT
jgi:hypothetical protein